MTVLSTQDLLWSLGSLCQLHRLPFSAQLIEQDLPPPHGLPALVDGLRRLGFSARSRGVRTGKLGKLPTPFLALHHVSPASPEYVPPASPEHVSPAPPETGTAEAATDPAAVNGPASGSPTATFRPALVVRIDGDRVLYFPAGSNTPVQAGLDEFAATYAGRVVQFRRETEALTDPDAVASTGKAFGFRWFIPVLLRHKAMWREVLLASLVLQIIGLATPLFTQVIIDKVIVHQTVSTLVVIGVALFVFMAFGAVLTWMRQHLLLLVGNRVDAVLGTSVFEHLFRLPLRYFEYRPTGVISARLHAVETIREFLAGTIVTLLLDLPFLVIFIAMMFWYSVTLTLIVLAVLGAVVVASLVIAPLFQKMLNRQFLVGARNQAFVTEYVAGMETVKSLQLEPQLRDRYRDYFGEYLEATRATRQLGNTYSVITNTLQQLMTLLVLVMGAWIVMTGTTLTIGMLVAFQMFASRLSQPLMGLVGLWQQFQQAKISVERLADLMNAPAEPYTLVPAREAVAKGEIEFADLGFRYGDDRPYLYRHFSLRVPAGSVFAVMGPSGSGKSTLAKLLLGFLQPVEGTLRIDGRDVRHLAANELRSAFGVVPQETTLFSGTVLENLVMANPHATFEEVTAACRTAEIHDAIERLPKGYQTELGERGVGLSGGQRQRLAIARALLRKPQVLILDEAVSNLDEQTAEHFCRTLNQLRSQVDRKVTILFITHQLPKSLQVDGVIRIGTPALASAAAPEKRAAEAGPAGMTP